MIESKMVSSVPFKFNLQRYIEDANDMDRDVFTRIVFARGVVGRWRLGV